MLNTVFPKLNSYRQGNMFVRVVHAQVTKSRSYVQNMVMYSATVFVQRLSKVYKTTVFTAQWAHTKNISTQSLRHDLRQSSQVISNWSHRKSPQMTIHRYHVSTLHRHSQRSMPYVTLQLTATYTYKNKTAASENLIAFVQFTYKCIMQ